MFLTVLLQKSHTLHMGHMIITPIPSSHDSTLLNSFEVEQGEVLLDEHPWTNIDRLSKLSARVLFSNIVINVLPCDSNKPPLC